MPLQVMAHLFGAGTVFIRPPPGPCSRRVRRRQANRHAGGAPDRTGNSRFHHRLDHQGDAALDV